MADVKSKQTPDDMLKEYLAWNALSFKCSPQLLSLLREETVFPGPREPVSFICPVRVMIIQPVKKYMIHFAVQRSYKPFGARQDRRYHGKGPDPFRVKGRQCLDPLA